MDRAQINQPIRFKQGIFAMEIKVTRYTSVNEGILVAYFSLLIPKWGGFYINGMKLFQKNGHFFIAFPDRKYEEDGKTKYAPYNGFTERLMANAFQDAVLKAIDVYCKENACKEKKAI